MRRVDFLRQRAWWTNLRGGLPLLRVTLHCGTLRRQFLGATYSRWRTSGRTRAVMIVHEVADLIPYGDSPVRRVSEGGEVLRRRLEGAGAVLDFSMLHDLKGRGAIDHYALPVTSALGSRRYVPWLLERLRYPARVRRTRCGFQP
jgi:adenylate cyclase